MDVAAWFALVVLVLAIVFAIIALVQVNRAGRRRQETLRARDEARAARDEARAAVAAARDARDTAATFLEAARTLREEARRASDEALSSRDEAARLAATLLEASQRPPDDAPSPEPRRREVAWTVRRMLRPGRYELVNVGTGTARSAVMRGAGEHPEQVRPDRSAPQDVPVEDGLGFAASRGARLIVEWSDGADVARSAELQV